MTPLNGNNMWFRYLLWIYIPLCMHFNDIIPYFENAIYAYATYDVHEANALDTRHCTIVQYWII